MSQSRPLTRSDVTNKCSNMKYAVMSSDPGKSLVVPVTLISVCNEWDQEIPPGSHLPPDTEWTTKLFKLQWFLPGQNETYPPLVSGDCNNGCWPNATLATGHWGVVLVVVCMKTFCWVCSNVVEGVGQYQGKGGIHHIDGLYTTLNGDHIKVFHVRSIWARLIHVHHMWPCRQLCVKHVILVDNTPWISHVHHYVAQILYM